MACVRIVSLLPSATEIVYALGLEDHLVGVTGECDEPPRARAEKAVVVTAPDTAGLSPAEIDGRVREQAADGTGLSVLDADGLARLAPDLILTQDLCRVCALPAGEVEQALDRLGCDADVLTLDPHSLEEVLATVLAVGRRTGSDDVAAALVAGLRARLAAVAAAVAGRPRPRVLVVEWVDPPFSAGHWVPDLVTAAGGQPVGLAPGTRSVGTSWTALADARPDLVVVAPCGFHLADAVTQAREVVDRLPSVPVWAVDADGLVVRPGPRLVDGVEALASVLHPGAVPPPPRGAVARVR